MSNREIVDFYLSNGLIQKCIDCQFVKKGKNSIEQQNKDDFFQDLIIILMEYDNEKLNDAVRNGHMNALVTRIIVNNIFSTTSKYYKEYKKYGERAEEITQIMEDTIKDEE